jgi:predicted nuclease of predicted toxin-antitoxin system
MRFLCDQNLERRVAAWLWEQGHDVTIGVVHYDGRLPDPEILSLAQREGRTLITNDKDFGELVWRQRLPHAGVIFFRLPAATAELKIARLTVVLRDHGDALDQFIVVTASRIRVRRPPQPPTQAV